MLRSPSAQPFLGRRPEWGGNYVHVVRRTIVPCLATVQGVGPPARGKRRLIAYAGVPLRALGLNYDLTASFTI